MPDRPTMCVGRLHIFLDYSSTNDYYTIVFQVFQGFRPKQLSIESRGHSLNSKKPGTGT